MELLVPLFREGIVSEQNATLSKAPSFDDPELLRQEAWVCQELCVRHLRIDTSLVLEVALVSDLRLPQALRTRLETRRDQSDAGPVATMQQGLAISRAGQENYSLRPSRSCSSAPPTFEIPCR